jgi:hypothetical protein
VIVWILSVGHALGAGSDASRLWLRAVVLAPVAPIVYLLVVRVFGARARIGARAVRPARSERRRRDQLEIASEASGGRR